MPDSLYPHDAGADYQENGPYHAYRAESETTIIIIMVDRTIQQIEEFAIQVFGNREKAEAWLGLPREPDGRTP